MMLTLPSPAKINLSLRVFGRRAEDGLHEVETVMQSVSLADELTFVKRQDGQIVLSCDNQELAVDDSNLIMQAANMLRANFSSELGANIHLKKNIPLQAGLGGGSSNAAVTLIGLACLWNLSAKLDDLADLGARLGSDVPFFFYGGTARAIGTGATVEPLADSDQLDLIIIMPDARVSTAEAYKLLARPLLTNNEPATTLRDSRSPSERFFESALDNLHNDFASVVYPHHPSIEQAHKALLECDAQYALMSGSGASVFGVFASEAARQQAFERLTQRYQDWRIWMCRTVNRESYRRLVRLDEV